MDERPAGKGEWDAMQFKGYIRAALVVLGDPLCKDVLDAEGCAGGPSDSALRSATFPASGSALAMDRPPGVAGGEMNATFLAAASELTGRDWCLAVASVREVLSVLTELSCEVFESVDRPWESGSPRGRALEDGAVEMEVMAVDCEGSRGFRSSETDGNAWVGLGVTTVTGEMSGKGFCNESSKLEGGLEEDEVVLVLLEDRLWVYGDTGGAGDVGLGWVLKKSSDLNCGMAGSNVGAEDFSDGRTVACGSLVL